MPKERASFFNDVPEIDISAFSPKNKEEGRAPEPEKVKAVARAPNFPSRESTQQPAKPVKARPARVYRTGRNVQFNVKALRETVETFYAITDKQGWVLGRRWIRRCGIAARAGCATMIRSRFYNPPFDLFLPTIVDLKFRDQKDTMERPFFSLSKSKRMKPIEYVNENDGIFVTVQPHQDYGMATIWDADILIWAASVLCDMKNRGTNDIPRELKFQPRSAQGHHALHWRQGLRAVARLLGAAQDHGRHHQHAGQARPENHDVQLD